MAANILIKARCQEKKFPLPKESFFTRANPLLLFDYCTYYDRLHDFVSRWRQNAIALYWIRNEIGKQSIQPGCVTPPTPRTKKVSISFKQNTTNIIMITNNP